MTFLDIRCKRYNAISAYSANVAHADDGFRFELNVLIAHNSPFRTYRSVMDIQTSLHLIYLGESYLPVFGLDIGAHIDMAAEVTISPQGELILLVKVSQ